MNIEFIDHSTVTLVQSNASDDMVALAAWVSNSLNDEERLQDKDKVKGLINFLYRNKHNCYSDDTEIFTTDGWVRICDLNGNERVLTLDKDTDEVKFERPSRVISYQYDGDLINIHTQSVDMLVTPNHLMYAAPRTHDRTDHWDMVRADEFENRSYRVRIGGECWIFGKGCTKVIERERINA
jgi:hypothetical protein